MKPVAFDFHRAASVADALAVVQADEDAKFIAGGQSLLAVMNYRLARPSLLVDISRLTELRRTFEEPDSMVLGALLTHRYLETDALIGRRLPLIREATRHIGHVAIRNSGTLGGSVAHADSSAEIPACLLALGATVFVESHGIPRREISIEEFFQGFYATSLEHGELITWIRVRAPGPGSGWGFSEVARRHGDFAEAGCAVYLERQQESVAARIALFGVADMPVLFTRTLEANGDLDASESREIIATLAPSDRPGYVRRIAQHCLTTALSDARTRLSVDEGDSHA